MIGFGTTPHNNRHRINQCWDQVIRWQHTLWINTNKTHQYLSIWYILHNYYNQSNCTSWKIKNCKSLVNRCGDLLISPPNTSPLSHKYHYQSTIVSSYSASLLSPVLHHISIPAQPTFSHQKSNHLLQIATFYTSNMAQYPYPTP